MMKLVAFEGKQKDNFDHLSHVPPYLLKFVSYKCIIICIAEKYIECLAYRGY